MQSKADIRYVVGIDLGTTNSALASIDLGELPRRLLSHDVPQLVGPGDVAPLPTLPSLHHHVGEHELPAGSTRLPWTPAEAEAPAYVIGELARTQAQVVPGRSVASAKSWLCHPRVDRLQDLLPWGGAADVPRLSPVEVSARILQHISAAFCHLRAARLDQAEVVLTVPASFDEVARELTVEAARRAGFDLARLTLLEEPQAAFYNWLADHARYAEEVEAGDQIFVCDIGGGTTDFTLISVSKVAGKVAFQRTAVGDHLLLGGDNMDLALARRVERQVGGGAAGKAATLPPHTFQGLVQAARTAKERLLGDDPPAEWSLHVAGRGARLIGGGLRATLRRDEVEEVLLDGFFPRVAMEAEPQRARLGLQELGLPYAPDPAVTRYMAAFLRQHRAAPTAVLFNGGVLRAQAIRQRILDVLEGWLGQRPRVLTNEAPDLSVARGAAYYALARRGEGLRISGGAARAYYVEVQSDRAARSAAVIDRAARGAVIDRAARAAVIDRAAGPEAGEIDASAATYVCLTPRGLEEGAEVELLGRPLELLTNRPVKFRLFSSVLREGDRPGDVLRLPAGELVELPPLYTVLRYPRSSQERPITVKLRARLTEIGTLELWAVAPEEVGADGGVREAYRWRLQFDLRSVDGPAEAGLTGDSAAAERRAVRDSREGREGGKETGAGPGTGPGPGKDGAGAEAGSHAGLLQAAAEQLVAVFQGTAAPAGLPKALQAVLGPRDGWSTGTLRGLWEPLKAVKEGRSRGAAHEARWLNLCGFCLRPGFGYPLDDWRVKEAWREWNAGLVHDRDEACKLEWWILWRRISGGLSRNQQEEIWKRVAPLVLGGARRVDKKPPGPQEAAEIYRALASCERLEVKKKIELGEALLLQIEKRRGDHALWSLGRLGARVPLYGSMDNVVPRATAEAWLGRLLALPAAQEWAAQELKTEVAQAAAELGRVSGDRVRDLSAGAQAKLSGWLRAAVPGAEGEHLAKVVTEVVAREEQEERLAFGDTLPVGLRLVSE